MCFKRIYRKFSYVNVSYVFGASLVSASLVNSSYEKYMSLRAGVRPRGASDVSCQVARVKRKLSQAASLEYPWIRALVITCLYVMLIC